MLEKLTNIEDHNPAHFNYLVHAPVSFRVSDLSLEHVKYKLERLHDPSLVYRTSLIAPQRTSTFGKIGVIVRPPEEAVLIAWDYDLGSPPDSIVSSEFIVKHKGKKKKWKQLLDPTAQEHNELFIQGSPLTTLEGVMYQASNLQENASLLQQRLRELYNQTLPILYVPLSSSPGDKQEHDLKKQFSMTRFYNSSPSLIQKLKRFITG